MNNEINYVSPFKKFCITIGNLPTAYLESMSYYEGLTYLVNYLSNNVIPALNHNGEVVEELQEQFTILKNYVDNYFDNLDVQEEINTKLDEMAESGQLTDIIAQYLGLAGMITFDTVADMKLAENLVNGSKCQTLGYYNTNDGGNALYKIRTITNEDVVDEMFIIALSDNSLIAELICEDSINIKKLGCKPTTDSATAIMKALSKNLKVIIPKGNWLSSPLTLTSGACIVGENINYEVETNDTATLNNISILQASQDCETFIDCSNSDHITLEICLSSCAMKSDYLNAKSIDNFVKLDNTCYSTFDLFILCLNNKGISIKRSWENTFKRLYFRGILNPNVIDIKCENSDVGCSQNIFNDIQSEGFGAVILDISEGLFYHNKIDSILSELTPYEPFVQTETASTVQIPLIKIGDGSNNVINNILLNNFSYKNGTYDGTIYEHSLFYVNSNNGSAFGVKVNNIIFDTGVNRSINFIKQEGEAGFLSSYLIIDNVINPTQYLIRTNLENMNYFKIGNIYCRFTNGTTRNNPIESITKWYTPADTSHTTMISNSTDYSPFNNENSVIKLDSTLSKCSALKVKTDDVIKVYYKSDVAIDYEIKIFARNNAVADTITGTLPIRSAYGLATLYTVTQNHINIAAISFSTSGNSYIGDILI